MKTKAYIIANNDLIATCDTSLKNGADVKYAYCKVEERINADREYNLVNARYATISRNKKWEKQSHYVDHAIEIEEAEFFIKDSYDTDY